MIGWINKAYLKAWLYWLRKDQYESTALRRTFRENFDIDVGLYSYGCFDQWRMPGPMTIGRYCSIAASVRVVPASHPYSALSTHPALYDKRFGVVNTDEPHKERLFIGDDVWIGHNAIILPSCKNIGRGAVIGAGSMVTRDVPSYTIVAGVPGRIIRDRFAPDLKAAIEESQWWSLDMGALASLAKSRPDLLSLPTPERLRAWRNSTLL